MGLRKAFLEEVDAAEASGRRLDSILLLCSHSARHRAVTQGIAAQNPLQDTSW
jgi:hypothetical protein